MRTIHALTIFLLLLTTACRAAAPAAPETRTCAMCEKPIPPGQEVTLVRSSGTSFFRCPHCALTAQAGLREHSVLSARSGITGEEIRVIHDADSWSVEPATAVFLSLPEAAGECLDRHKAFANTDEFSSYMGAHHEFDGLRARPYTIAEIARVLAAGLPEDDSATPLAPNAPHVLVVGMVTHLPFKTDVLPEIQKATDPLGTRVRLQFVDATAPAGRAILGAHGIHEHLPVVIFIEDRSAFEVGSRTIRFQGFPGRDSWTASDLEQVLGEFLDRD